MKRLKATGAILFWASTTPIVKSNGIYMPVTKLLTIRLPKESQKARVPINDMHRYGLEYKK